MICCGNLAIVVLLGAGAGQPDSVPVNVLATRVRVEMATRWHVDTAAITLEWGQLPPLSAADAAAPMRLVGGGSDGWYLVVVEPVRAAPHAVRVRVGTMRLVHVAAHALRAGAPLVAADIDDQSGVVWSPPGADSLLPLLGWEVRRDVAAGTVLGATVVVAPRVIATGDKVVFAWAHNGVRVEREAQAIGPARLGEVVQARAGTTRLEGRAIGPGLAELKEVVR